MEFDRLKRGAPMDALSIIRQRRALEEQQRRNQQLTQDAEYRGELTADQSAVSLKWATVRRLVSETLVTLAEHQFPDGQEYKVVIGYEKHFSWKSLSSYYTRMTRNEVLWRSQAEFENRRGWWFYVYLGADAKLYVDKYPDNDYPIKDKNRCWSDGLHEIDESFVTSPDEVDKIINFLLSLQQKARSGDL